jgi:hypothetical protein
LPRKSPDEGDAAIIAATRREAGQNDADRVAEGDGPGQLDDHGPDGSSRATPVPTNKVLLLFRGIS